MTATQEEIYLYCNADEDWQRFRKKLKGISTAEKLERVSYWREERKAQGVDERRTQVQTDNYINALKRSGLVSKEGDVLR